MKTILENYLENECHFRDYDIYPISKFRTINTASTVHQVVSADSLEHDVDDAINTFCRDGYSNICFYLEK